MNLPSHVQIVEVGPRDGLQNEKSLVATSDKIELITRLQNAGLCEIETTSFVSPKWVPQMADNAEVMRAIPRQAGVRYAVLVPNMQGLQAAQASQPDEIVVFGAASQSFSQRNINCSIEESLARFEPVVQAAKAAGLSVRGALSCALGCPYEGDIAASEVGRVAGLFKAIGVTHLGMADTIGVGTPRKTQAALEAILRHYDVLEVSGHFHDTYGQALANTYACLELGVARFDTSVAGLGGCPYAQGASGNVATEDTVYMLHGMGIETGIDLTALAQTGAWISNLLGRSYASRAGMALLSKQKKS